MDFLEYKTSFIWNVVPFGNVMFVLPEPSTKFVVPDMVLILAFINVNLRNIFYLKELCVWLHSLQDSHHPHSS